MKTVIVTQLSGNVQLGCYKKSGTGDPLHTQEPVTVASFRTWRGWRERVARDRCLTYPILTFVKKSNALRLDSPQASVQAARDGPLQHYSTQGALPFLIKITNNTRHRA